MKKEKAMQIATVFIFCSSIAGCINTLENSLTAPPHFRKVWWGSTKASVLTKEKGKRIHVNTGGSLVYKTRYGSVPTLLVYCFGSHNGIYRLRAAGYLTAQPAVIADPDSVFRRNFLEELGEPSETFADGGMVWKDAETVIYTNSYEVASTNSNFLARSSPGLIIPIPRRQRQVGWYLIAGYIDRRFYDGLQEFKTEEALQAELSYYEEIFFGMFLNLQR